MCKRRVGTIVHTDVLLVVYVTAKPELAVAGSGKSAS
jgi:hypothetical protein